MLGEPHQICAEVRPEPTNNENQLLCRTNVLEYAIEKGNISFTYKSCFGKEMYLSNTNFSFLLSTGPKVTFWNLEMCTFSSQPRARKSTYCGQVNKIANYIFKFC